MSFLKAFGISFIVFIVLNIVFFLIGYLILGILDTYFAGLAVAPSNITFMIFGPLANGIYPYHIISQFSVWFGGNFLEIDALTLYIGYIVAPLAAAILSGRFGETKIEAFGGWFAAAMVIALVTMIWNLVVQIIASAPFAFIVFDVVRTIGIGLVYGFGYGCISLLITK